MRPLPPNKSNVRFAFGFTSNQTTQKTTLKRAPPNFSRGDRFGDTKSGSWWWLEVSLKVNTAVIAASAGMNPVKNGKISFQNPATGSNTVQLDPHRVQHAHAQHARALSVPMSKTVSCSCGWVLESISHHPRNHRMIRFPNVNTYKRYGFNHSFKVARTDFATIHSYGLGLKKKNKKTPAQAGDLGAGRRVRPRAKAWARREVFSLTSCFL